MLDPNWKDLPFPVRHEPLFAFGTRFPSFSRQDTFEPPITYTNLEDLDFWSVIGVWLHSVRHKITRAEVPEAPGPDRSWLNVHKNSHDQGINVPVECNPFRPFHVQVRQPHAIATHGWARGEIFRVTEELRTGFGRTMASYKHDATLTIRGDNGVMLMIPACGCFVEEISGLRLKTRKKADDSSKVTLTLGCDYIADNLLANQEFRFTNVELVRVLHGMSLCEEVFNLIPAATTAWYEAWNAWTSEEPPLGAALMYRNKLLRALPRGDYREWLDRALSGSPEDK